MAMTIISQDSVGWLDDFSADFAWGHSHSCIQLEGWLGWETWDSLTHTSVVDVGWGTLVHWSRSAFQENKGGATRSLKGEAWKSHHFTSAAFYLSQTSHYWKCNWLRASSLCFEIHCWVCAEATGWILSQTCSWAIWDSVFWPALAKGFLDDFAEPFS